MRPSSAHPPPWRGGGDPGLDTLTALPVTWETSRVRQERERPATLPPSRWTPSSDPAQEGVLWERGGASARGRGRGAGEDAEGGTSEDSGEAQADGGGWGRGGRQVQGWGWGGAVRGRLGCGGVGWRSRLAFLAHPQPPAQPGSSSGLVWTLTHPWPRLMPALSPCLHRWPPSLPCAVTSTSSFCSIFNLDLAPRHLHPHPSERIG